MCMAFKLNSIQYTCGELFDHLVCKLTEQYQPLLCLSYALRTHEGRQAEMR